MSGGDQWQKERGLLKHSLGGEDLGQTENKKANVVLLPITNYLIC